MTVRKDSGQTRSDRGKKRSFAVYTNIISYDWKKKESYSEMYLMLSDFDLRVPIMAANQSASVPTKKNEILILKPPKRHSPVSFQQFQSWSRKSRKNQRRMTRKRS